MTVFPVTGPGTGSYRCHRGRDGQGISIRLGQSRSNHDRDRHGDNRD
jgi:hypothetical protein